MDLVRVNSHDEETWQLIGDFPPTCHGFFQGTGQSLQTWATSFKKIGNKGVDGNTFDFP